MLQKFAFLSFAILCFTTAYHLGAKRANAEWDGGAPGQIIGGAFAQGGPWIGFTSAGEAWSITPAAGWIRRADMDLPVATSEVKFLDSNGELFIVVTTADDVWEFADNGLGWFQIDSFPGGPITTESESLGAVKGRYRE